MTVTWRNILAIVFVAVALMLLAAVPAANPPKELGFFEMEDATELIVADTTDALDAYVAIPAPDRPSETPGGAVAPGSHPPFTAEYAVLSGGAAGLAAAGIRGPTKL